MVVLFLLVSSVTVGPVWVGGFTGLCDFPALGICLVRSMFEPGSGPGFMRAFSISCEIFGGFVEVPGIRVSLGLA